MPTTPATTALQAYPFGQILSVIVARIAQSLNVDPVFIYPVASDDYKVTVLETLFSYLRIYAPQPCDAQGNPFPNIGAGRYGRNIARRIRVYIYTRSGTDTYGKDILSLIGNLPEQDVTTPPNVPAQCLAEEIVLNGLDNFTPLVGSGDTAQSLTLCPLQWITDNGPPVRKAENEEGLIRSHLDFLVMYVAAQQAIEPSPLVLPIPSSNN